jgi:hypothetical protein
VLEIPWDKLVNVASLLVLVLQGVMAWVVWSLRKQFMTRESCDGRCGQVEERQSKADSRMTEMEAAQRSMPTAKDINSLNGKLGGIEGEIKALLATVRGQADTMRRIEHPLNLLLEHHLNGERK